LKVYIKRGIIHSLAYAYVVRGRFFSTAVLAMRKVTHQMA